MSEEIGDEEYVDQLIGYLKGGGTIQDVYNMTETDMEVMFLAASRYFQIQKFEEAADSFLFLTFLNPYQSKFWLGLGEALKMNKEYERAVEAYTMASLNDCEDPRPYFHAAACLMQLDKLKKAHERLSLCVIYAQEIPGYHSLAETSEELMDDIKHRLEEQQKAGESS